MDSSCGVPGCRYPKFTLDGNKSFKCSYWKNRARKKVEQISERLMLNKHLAHLPMEPIPIREMYEKKFSLKNDLSEVHIFQDPEEFYEPSLFQEPVPRPIVVTEAQLQEEVSRLKQVALSDPLATKQIDSVHSVLRGLTTVLLDHLKATADVPRDIKNVVNYVSSVQDEVFKLRNISNDNIKKNQILEKRIVNLELKVDKSGQDQDRKDDKTVLYEQVPLSKLDFEHVIKYSKYLNRKSKTNVESRGFVITRDKSLIYYLVKTYPGIFKCVEGIDYSKLVEKQIVHKQIENNTNFIWILPNMEVNFDKYMTSDHCVVILEDVSSRIFKNYERMYVDNNLWIEFFIMSKFQNGITYEFESIKWNQDVLNYEEYLRKFIVSNGYRSESEFYSYFI